MPRVDVVVESAIRRSSRVAQIEGLFDVPAAEKSRHEWSADFPLDAKPWNIGLIVGPSGCGKSTVLRALAPDAASDGFAWSDDRAVVDDFDQTAGVREVCDLLSSVGFSSPPGWLKPYRVLSNGEQFRVRMARALAAAKPDGLTCVDEFTSVVDRTVAQIGSAAMAKAIRRRGLRFVFASCHFDILDWLQPDWVFNPADCSFAWRSLQRRPVLTLTIRRVHRSAWALFRQHHYLSADLNKAARCFVGFVDGRPATFSAVLSFPHALRPGWREHRTVCLPDFQGVGLGNAMSARVGAVVRGMGFRYTSRTSHPAMIRSRLRSKEWRCITTVGTHTRISKHRKTGAGLMGDTSRVAASFAYVGPALDNALAQQLWEAA